MEPCQLELFMPEEDKPSKVLFGAITLWNPQQALLRLPRALEGVLPIQGYLRVLGAEPVYVGISGHGQTGFQSAAQYIYINPGDQAASRLFGTRSGPDWNPQARVDTLDFMTELPAQSLSLNMVGFFFLQLDRVFELAFEVLVSAQHSENLVRPTPTWIHANSPLKTTVQTSSSVATLIKTIDAVLRDRPHLAKMREYELQLEELKVASARQDAELKSAELERRKIEIAKLKLEAEQLKFNCFGIALRASKRQLVLQGVHSLRTHTSTVCL